MRINKTYTLTLAILLISCNALFAQTWEPGHYTDRSGAKYAGFIRSSPGGKGPIAGEGYIEFKDAEDGDASPLSTSDLQSFVAGQDSFVVAKAPATGNWSKVQTDFLRVVMNEDVKVYALRVADGKPATYKGSIHTKKPRNTAWVLLGGYYVNPNSAIVQNGTMTKDGLYRDSPNFTLPTGRADVKKPNNRGSNYEKLYYFGSTAAEMQSITDANFKDAIAAAMKSQPKVVDYIQANSFGLDNITELIAYFNIEKAKGN